MDAEVFDFAAHYKQAEHSSGRESIQKTCPLQFQQLIKITLVRGHRQITSVTKNGLFPFGFKPPPRIAQN